MEKENNKNFKHPDGRTKKQIELDELYRKIYESFDRLSLINYKSKNAVIR